ncbi:hypothetical protein AUEXF2481DRAFT_552200 [Aureobasidium subglaciale EXF-2481]|uniref:Uncharacterized protein n=1 Tax=Aureobasidium subglaciale (strain EXF-2481) TaxID=1043005 RepID=A0A074YJL3_AURSE|nr:uncharacterized protein AUEXF2481DRAFT_552200 [Aureobasidium subglaciale EXF-2481]KEQ97890.1 hypothetical protein AUEXF2481DRAFT_552200 [Aureobasidium subglaciale EXF-2481]
MPESIYCSYPSLSLDLTTTYSVGMSSLTKHTVRWRRMCDGYGKYWYYRSAIRWAAITTAVVSLIVFGAVWPDFSQYAYSYEAQLGGHAFSIAAVRWQCPYHIQDECSRMTALLFPCCQCLRCHPTIQGAEEQDLTPCISARCGPLGSRCPSNDWIHRWTPGLLEQWFMDATIRARRNLGLESRTRRPTLGHFRL